jgi:hypothetical protein
MQQRPDDVGSNKLPYIETELRTLGPLTARRGTTQAHTTNVLEMIVNCELDGERLALSLQL